MSTVTKWYELITEREEEAVEVLATIIDGKIMRGESLDDITDNMSDIADYLDCDMLEALARGIIPHGSNEQISEYIKFTLLRVGYLYDFEEAFLPCWLTAGWENGKFDLVLGIALNTLGCDITTLTSRYIDLLGYNEDVCRTLVLMTDPKKFETHIRDTCYPEDDTSMDHYNSFR